jgi:RNA polymerase primary sigma factor
MRSMRRDPNPDALVTTLDDSQTQLLDPQEERTLLRELAACKADLDRALARVPGLVPPSGDDPQAAGAGLAAHYAALAEDGPAHAQLGATLRRYRALRTRLAMANMRLVAHVARRFRDRGLAYGDLLQEGVLGLLEAIDRFDLAHGTKLATYATWWIRQAIQRAVAAGAYPVRLSPRHLRQLARNQDELDRPGAAGRRPGPAPRPSDEVSPEILRRIHAATRPAVSLDARRDGDPAYSLVQPVPYPEADCADDLDMGEAVGCLMEGLRPRERQVIALRFGLGGQPRLSLSQVGRLLEVSKERVRQIQDRALAKLRDAARQSRLADTLLGV